jgi:hypothetical protein
LISAKLLFISSTSLFNSAKSLCIASNLLYTDCEVYPRLSCDNAAALHGRGKFAQRPKAIENRRIEIVLAFMWPLDHERWCARLSLGTIPPELAFACRLVCAVLRRSSMARESRARPRRTRPRRDGRGLKTTVAAPASMKNNKRRLQNCKIITTRRAKNLISDDVPRRADRYCPAMPSSFSCDNRLFYRLP